MKKIKAAHWAIGGALAVSLGLGGGLTMVIRLPLSTGPTPVATQRGHHAGSTDRR